MAIFKATIREAGEGKGVIGYIQQRPGKDKEAITTLFSRDGALGRLEAEAL
jgi:hypothetical protein